MPHNSTPLDGGSHHPGPSQCTVPWIHPIQLSPLTSVGSATVGTSECTNIVTYRACANKRVHKLVAIIRCRVSADIRHFFTGRFLRKFGIDLTELWPLACGLTFLAHPVQPTATSVTVDPGA